MMIRSLLVALSLVLSFQSSAGALKSEAEIRSLADSVMKIAGSGDIVGALNKMAPYTVIPETEFQSLVLKSKSQRDQYGAIYGKSVGYEFIGQKLAGGALLRLTYIEKTEKHVFPWIFYFYKSPSGWVINSFQWNDQLSYAFSAN